MAGNCTAHGYYYTGNACPVCMSYASRYENPTLNEREKTHGDFEQNAAIAQGIKSLMGSGPSWAKMSNAQSEALDLIATKIGRITTGNPNELDHWNDIAGYADLIAERLKTSDPVPKS